MSSRQLRVLSALAVAALAVAGSSCTRDDPDSADITSTSESTAAPATSSSSTTPDETTSTSTVVTSTSTSTSVTSTSEPERRVDVRIYLLRGERLVIEHRDVVPPAVLGGAIGALLEGPGDDELLTAIPAGTRLLGVDLDNGVATVDLSSEFESGGGSMSMFARIGQIVFTSTQFDNVEAVRFRIDGEDIEYLGGEGLDMTEPWTRAMVPRDLTGAVIVDEPQPGDTVTSPFTVTGEGDVFEADFPIEIRRDGVTLLVIAPITAGAWGDWRDFATTISLDIDPGPFELVALDQGGCGDAPECPPDPETVVPLVLAD